MGLSISPPPSLPWTLPALDVSFTEISFAITTRGLKGKQSKMLQKLRPVNNRERRMGRRKKKHRVNLLVYRPMPCPLVFFPEQTTDLTLTEKENINVLTIFVLCTFFRANRNALINLKCQTNASRNKSGMVEKLIFKYLIVLA